MTKTMVSGLLTWLCGLAMLIALIANIPVGSAEQATTATGPAIEAEAPTRDL